MKTFFKTILLLSVCNVAKAQIPTIEQYQAEQSKFWNNSLISVNRSLANKMLGGTILYDKVTPFASLFTYNEEENNISYDSHFRQALSEMHRASDKTLFESVESLDKKITQYAGTNIVPIGILDVDFSYLNYTPENPHLNALELQNGVFRSINNRPAYTHKHISVVSPLAKLVQGQTIVFRFENSWWYRYGNKVIQSLTADFGDGTPIPIIQNGNLLKNDFSVSYTQNNETKKLSFNITYNDGSTLTTYAGIGVMSPPNSSSLKRYTSSLLKYTSTIPDPNTRALAQIEYRIFYGNNNTDKKLKKPFIIVDGFDPGDKRKITYEDCAAIPKCVSDNDNFKKGYKSIEDLMKYGKDNNLKSQLTELGYDVIIVNFPTYTNNLGQEVDGGADDIFQNGRTIASFIQYINEQLKNNGSTEKLVVVGPSMGGQITRYALAYLEKYNIPTNTRLWISMDSPHQGANIPLAVQGNLYWMGEILQKEEAKQKYRSNLLSKAARQMLIKRINGNEQGGFRTSYISTSEIEHKNYLKELKSNGVDGSDGYPILNGIKKIAITNGSISGRRNVNAGEKFYEVAAFAKVRFFGIKVDNKPVFRINNWFMPEKQTENILFDNFSHSPSNKIHWRYSNNFSFGSLDAVPGGNFNSADELKDEVYHSLKGTNALSFPLGVLVMSDKKLIVQQRIPSNIHTSISPQSFIPTHSALDTKGFSDWYQPIDYDIVCSGQTPFDSYYGENINMEHVSFTGGMVSWLLNWLNGNEQIPNVNLSNISISTDKKVVCNNETLSASIHTNGSVCNIPNSFVWSTSDNMRIIGDSTKRTIQIEAIRDGLGYLHLTFPNGQKISQKIWVGKPKVKLKVEPHRLGVKLWAESVVDGVSLADQGISIQWKNHTTGETYNGIRYNTPANGNTMERVEATISNNCGSEKFEKWVARTCDNDFLFSLTKTYSDNYTLTYIRPCVEPGFYENAYTTYNQSETFTIQISNAMGQIVLTTKNKEFSLAHLLAGTYYARVIKNGQVVHTQTLLKQ